jgi:hypothetical protein
MYTEISGILLLTVWYEKLLQKKTFFTKKESGPKFQAEFFGQALYLI